MAIPNVSTGQIIDATTFGNAVVDAVNAHADQFALYLPLTGGTLTGDLQVDGVIKASKGNSSRPGITFNGDTDTGLYWNSDNNLVLTAGGARIFRVDKDQGAKVFGDLQVDGNADLIINAPADAWGGTTRGTVFTPQGLVGGTQGSFATAMTSNGYRNDSGGWTSLGLNGQAGATTMELHPNGTFYVRTAGTMGANDPAPPIRFSVNNGLTKAYGVLQVDGQTKAQNGTKTAAAYSFTSDPKTGVYLHSTGVLALTANGKDVARLGDAGVAFPGHKTTSAPPNCHIQSDGQLMRSTAAKVDSADIKRLENIIKKLSDRIGELETRLISGGPND
jgi:hypothetical protein